MDDDQQLVLFDKKNSILICGGEWIIDNYPLIQNIFAKMSWPNKRVIIDGRDIKRMDTAGVWILNQWIQKLKDKGIQTELQHFSKQSSELLHIVQKRSHGAFKIPVRKVPNSLARLGKYSIELATEGRDYLNFIGKLTFEFIRTALNPFRWRWNEVAGCIARTGVDALPIIALLSFMIGIVISYQMGNQLRAYGANVFIVDLLGLSILREFGPLITAIMVAGRTGSAFTAQLGIMKINQEIDALDTMGVTPGELLLIPRIIGLFIVMPLLTIWSDIFGVFGGMIMANNMLDISWTDFIYRFQQEIPVRALVIGIGKAPVFALMIASIGCFQGMQVSGSAQSVGRLTTRSVVLSIFFIIIADAIFSVIFSKLQL